MDIVDIVYVFVLTLAGDNVYRKYAAKSFDDVRTAHLKHPNHPIGVFTAADGTGDFWSYWPDLAASEAFEESKERRRKRR
jgi:hypothetical protein